MVILDSGLLFGPPCITHAQRKRLWKRKRFRVD